MIGKLLRNVEKFTPKASVTLDNNIVEGVNFSLFPVGSAFLALGGHPLLELEAAIITFQ